jgi:hypothetical protein
MGVVVAYLDNILLLAKAEGRCSVDG